MFNEHSEVLAIPDNSMEEFSDSIDGLEDWGDEDLPPKSERLTDIDSLINHDVNNVSEKCSELHPKRKVPDKENWKSNKRITKRLRGEEYTDSKGIVRPAKPMKPALCLERANHKTFSCKVFTEEERVNIYSAFRGLKNLTEQRIFISNNIEKVKSIRSTIKGTSRRHMTFTYFLTANNERRKVCRIFFMDTLNVTDAMIRTSIKKKNYIGMVEEDKRGKHAPHHKISKEDDKFIRDHINSFPAMDYCRKSSTKKYLNAALNITKLHNLYMEACQQTSKNPVSLQKYRMVFNEYNLGFYHPKKDQYRTRLNYNNLNGDEKLAKKHDRKIHIDKKNSARTLLDN